MVQVFPSDERGLVELEGILGLARHDGRGVCVLPICFVAKYGAKHVAPVCDAECV